MAPPHVNVTSSATSLANSTLTKTSTSTSTLTLTGTTTTHTIQAKPVLVFGLPPELVAILGIAVVAIAFLFFRFQVKGVPVQLVWIYKNGSALMLRVNEDLQGIFLDVIRGGKKVESLKKRGIALPVKYIPSAFKAYVDIPNSDAEGAKVIQELRNKGYAVNEQAEQQKQKGFWRRRIIKVYLVEKAHGVAETLAYLDVNMGGLKTARLYATIEGTGETIDWKPRIDAAPETDSGNTILLQEMKSAAKGFFALLAEAMQGTLRSMVLPLVAGVGLGGTVIFLVLDLTGHLH